MTAIMLTCSTEAQRIKGFSSRITNIKAGRELKKEFGWKKVPWQRGATILYEHEEKLHV